MSNAFQLPAELTIYSVGETRDALLAWLIQEDCKSGDSVSIEAASVEEADGAGVQLLGALINSLKQRGVTWQFHSPSANLIEVCDILGCRAWIDQFEAGGVTR